MRTRSAESGYALLAALVVMALAGLLAAAVVGAVTGEHSIAAADRGHDEADAAAWRSLDELAAKLRWRPWVADAPLSPTGWRTAAVQAQGASGRFRSAVRAKVEVRAPEWCGGLSTAGDAQLRAPVTVVNSGAYVGGSLRGRQLLTFGPEPAGGGAPADLVHGDLWEAAAVHALGGIWADGVEIHGGGAGKVDPAWALDTDTHTGEGRLLEVTEGPEAVLLGEFGTKAMAPDAALKDDVLDVSLLPATPPSGAGADPAEAEAGIAVFAPATDQPLMLVGERPANACPLALVVMGDAVAGGEGVPLSLRGALAVNGRLEVDGPTTIEGCLHAQELATTEALTVVVGADWKAHTLVGLSMPVIVRLVSE